MNSTSSPGQQSMRVIAKDPLADGVVALRLADAAGDVCRRGSPDHTSTSFWIH